MGKAEQILDLSLRVSHCEDCIEDYLKGENRKTIEQLSRDYIILNSQFRIAEKRIKALEEMLQSTTFNETQKVLKLSNLDGGNVFPLHKFKINDSVVPQRVMGVCSGKHNTAINFQIVFYDSEDKLIWENSYTFENKNKNGCGINFNELIDAPPIPSGGYIEVASEFYIHELLITFKPVDYVSLSVLPVDSDNVSNGF